MPFLNIAFKNLFYTDTHPSSSSPRPASTTLFLHGLGSSSNFYTTIIPSLQDRTRCIALDYPGSGLSELEDEISSIEILACDVIDFLDALNVKKVNLVGHSMGGLLASYIASEHPNSITSITLLGPVNPTPALGPIFTQRISTIRSSGLETLAASIPTTATGPNSTALQKEFIRTLILSTSETGYIALCNAIANATKPDYGVIDQPLLMLVGEMDKTSTLESCEEVFEEYGSLHEKSDEEIKVDKRMVVLKGVGHWHCVEDGEEVARLIRHFLGSLG